MNFSRIGLVVISLVLLFLLGPGVAGGGTFKDVPVNHWAYESVGTLTEAGVIAGFPDGTFKPGLKVTREQFAKALVVTLDISLNENAPQIFSDVKPGHWSFQYVDAAKSYIPTLPQQPGHFNFYGNRVITREEAAHAIALALGLDKSPKPDTNYLAEKFRDYQNISSQFRESAALTAYYGILSGDANNNFRSKDGLTRAEISIILERILQAAEKPAAQDSDNTATIKRHQPWTIEFVDFKRPDYKMVEKYPGYNKIQTFYGTVTSSVYGFNDPHFVVQHTSLDYEGKQVSVKKTKTVYIYVYEEELELFTKGDKVSFNYDRDNNVTSYDVEWKMKD